MGGAIRLAACLDVALDVIEPCGFPLGDRALKRAAMDYGRAADANRWDSWESYRRDRPEGRLLLFTTKAAEPFHRFEYRRSDILLFGRESAGVPDEVHAAADARLFIPIRPETRSLNVVTAAALALGEALRQTDAYPSSPSR